MLNVRIGPMPWCGFCSSPTAKDSIEWKALLDAKKKGMWQIIR
ncbi:MAG TPA: hypothetical protein VEG44_10105 [Candidatus Acidoferrales bacterium]|nr:hypothetical protein [Candidatus Acidoferrales bacterium]